jgi:hypothetical protein
MSPNYILANNIKLVQKRIIIINNLIPISEIGLFRKVHQKVKRRSSKIYSYIHYLSPTFFNIKKNFNKRFINKDTLLSSFLQIFDFWETCLESPSGMRYIDYS